jgi:lipopolysaccharide/colanic/teichoic acid biosynthesis glycosyltransferase
MLDCDLPLDSRFAKDRFRRRVLVWGDALAVPLAFAAAAYLSPSGEFEVALQVEPLAAIGSLLIAILCVLASLQLARMHSGSSWFARLQQICLALGSLFLLEAFLSYIGFAWLLDLSGTFLGSVIAGVLLVLWYLAFRLLFPGLPGHRRILLLGEDVAFPELGGLLTTGPGGAYQILGPLPFPADPRPVANEWLPNEIVVGGSADESFPANELLDLRFQGVTIRDAATFFENTLQRVSCRHLEPVRFLYGEMAPMRKNLALQAIYSNALGLAALAVSSPAMICAAIALKISSPKIPLMDRFYAAGLHGIPFDRLCFQSRSKLGKWMARTGLGGLPQLFNVVRGEMSLVGPRASRSDFHEALTVEIPYYSQRLAVRPGLTGWAQINKKHMDASVELEYDLYYIKHLSPSFDLDILMASILNGFGD